MADFLNYKFYNPSKGHLNFSQVIGEVFSYLEQSPKNLYEIVVGCDSSSEKNPNFPVALVVLRKGFGGRFFLTKINYQNKKKFYNLRERILEEVYLSCEMALLFKDALTKHLIINNSKNSFNFQFEYIHADVGTIGPTKDMIKEVVGLIKSNGFAAKIKPESFAASIIADRFS